jgi:hypothetical protein
MWHCSVFVALYDCAQNPSETASLQKQKHSCILRLAARSNRPRVLADYNQPLGAIISAGGYKGRQVFRRLWLLTLTCLLNPIRMAIEMSTW